jgi:hypothetical protein
MPVSAKVNTLVGRHALPRPLGGTARAGVAARAATANAVVGHPAMVGSVSPPRVRDHHLFRLRGESRRRAHPAGEAQPGGDALGHSDADTHTHARSARMVDARSYGKASTARVEAWSVLILPGPTPGRRSPRVAGPTLRTRTAFTPYQGSVFRLAIIRPTLAPRGPLVVWCQQHVGADWFNHPPVTPPVPACRRSRPPGVGRSLRPSMRAQVLHLAIGRPPGVTPCWRR